LLDISSLLVYSFSKIVQVLITERRGNPVKIRDGPAAVTGDESCIDVTDRMVGKAQ